MSLGHSPNLHKVDRNVEYDINPVTGGSEIRNTPRLTTLAVQLFAIHAQSANGTYFGTAENSAGGFGGRVCTIAGDITGSPTVTGMTATTTSGLFEPDAITLIGGGVVTTVWPIADGNTAIFCVVAGSGKGWLYKVKYNGSAWTCGNNAPAYDNKGAIMRVGLVGGTHTPFIFALHHRSLCEATIGGASVLLFGEYNVAGGRVAGGTNDQVRLWKSTDSGDTWSAVLTFNQAGVKHADHIHSVLQDPATGNVVCCVGDIANAAVIVWDGTSAPPTANSTYATIDATPGWRAHYGQAKYTTGDVLFSARTAFYLPDVDLLTGGAQYVMEFDRLMTYAVPSKSFQKSNNIPPLIGCRTQDGISIFVSLVAATSADPFFHIWGSADDVNFTRIAKLTQHNIVGNLPAVGTICNAFFDSAGRLIISGVVNRGTKLAAGGSNGATCVICSVRVEIDGYSTAAETIPTLN